jgi:hypothetical protein
MTRYEISPERSHLWIDARSNVHPIHTGTDGLEGYVDLELASDGHVDVTSTPEGKLSLSVDKLSSGNRLEDRELYKRTATVVTGSAVTSPSAGCLALTRI